MALSAPAAAEPAFPPLGGERTHSGRNARSESDPSRKSSTPFAVGPTRPRLCHQAVLSCSPRAERWLNEATARHDTASTEISSRAASALQELIVADVPWETSGEM